MGFLMHALFLMNTLIMYKPRYIPLSVIGWHCSLVKACFILVLFTIMTAIQYRVMHFDTDDTFPLYMRKHVKQQNHHGKKLP